MRVIRHQSGWDIALDMVFTDKQTADTIAERIQYAVYALVRDAVDASMCGSKEPINIVACSRPSAYVNPTEQSET